MRQTIRRPLMVILISVILAFLLSCFLPTIGIVIGAITVLLVSVPLFCFRKTRIWVGLIGIPLLLSFLYFYLFLTIRYQPIKQYEGKSVILKGRVISETVRSDNAKHFTMRCESICSGYDVQKRSFDILVYIPKDDTIPKVGSGIRCTGKPFRDTAEDTFPEYRDTVGEFLSVYSTDVTEIYSAEKYDWNALCAAVRAKVFSVYEKTCFPETAAFLKGLTLGMKDSMPEDVDFAFKSSGVSHVLAVSGMHLVFLTSLLWMILSLATPNLKVRAGVMIVVIACFTAVTGFSPSCCRAAIMLTIFQIGVLIDRESDPFTALPCAVVLCALPNPMAILNPSLLLSATATLGIMLLFNPILYYLPNINNTHSVIGKIRSFVQTTLSMSVAAVIGTLPVMAFLFQSVSLVSPLTNILIIFPVEILFTLGFAAVLLSWISPIRFLLKYACEGLYLYCKWVTQKLSALPISSVYTGSLRFWIYFTVIAVAVTGLILLNYRFEKLKLLPMLCAFAVIISGIGYFTEIGNRDEVCAYYVNSGQGNATLISHDHTAILIDCGGSELGLRQINQTLVKGNIKSISTIYITHMDDDHICYADNILERYSVRRLVLPYRVRYSDSGEQLISVAQKRGTHIDYITDDERDTVWAGTEIEIFTDHISSFEKNDNQNSLIYKFTYGENELLFVGDITKSGEKLLAERYREELSCDILEASHHGSDTSSTDIFLRYAVPEITIVSVGKDNSYGLPNAKALRRLAKYSDKVLRTDRSGTICVTMNSAGYKIAEDF